MSASPPAKKRKFQPIYMDIPLDVFAHCILPFMDTPTLLEWTVVNKQCKESIDFIFADRANKLLQKMASIFHELFEEDYTIENNITFKVFGKKVRHKKQSKAYPDEEDDDFYMAYIVKKDHDMSTTHHLPIEIYKRINPFLDENLVRDYAESYLMAINYPDCPSVPSEHIMDWIPVAQYFNNYKGSKQGMFASWYFTDLDKSDMIQNPNYKYLNSDEYVEDYKGPLLLVKEYNKSPIPCNDEDYVDPPHIVAYKLKHGIDGYFCGAYRTTLLFCARKESPHYGRFAFVRYFQDDSYGTRTDIPYANIEYLQLKTFDVKKAMYTYYNYYAWDGKKEQHLIQKGFATIPYSTLEALELKQTKEIKQMQ